MNLRTFSIFIAFLLIGHGFAAQPTNMNSTPPKQALTYANVVSHFKSAHFRAAQVHNRCTVFYEGERKSADVYNYCLIIVENSDEDLQVTFQLTDAHEMNWVTEFLDAPFFAKDETQKLFEIMNSHRGTTGQKVGRFRVDFHRWQPHHAEILVFSFTPAKG